MKILYTFLYSFVACMIYEFGKMLVITRKKTRAERSQSRGQTDPSFHPLEWHASTMDDSHFHRNLAEAKTFRVDSHPTPEAKGLAVRTRGRALRRNDSRSLPPLEIIQAKEHLEKYNPYWKWQGDFSGFGPREFAIRLLIGVP